jgi:hypothetical protein
MLIVALYFSPSKSFAHTPQTAARKIETEKAGFCHLVRNPDQYDGKLVTVTAMIAAGPEGSIFHDNACEASPSEPDLFAVVAFSQENYKFGSPIDKRLRTLLKKSPARVTVVGRFVDGKDQPFGHLNCCRYKLEVQELLVVERVSQAARDKPKT